MSKTLHGNKNIPITPYVPLKVVFVMKSSVGKVLKIYPVPYKFEIDFKKIKELTKKCQN